MAVRFVNNSIQIKDALNSKAVAWLYEAGGELEAQTKDNMPPGGEYYSQQKNAWKHIVEQVNTVNHQRVAEKAIGFMLRIRI